MKKILIESQEIVIRRDAAGRRESGQTDYLATSPLVKHRKLALSKAEVGSRDEVHTSHILTEEGLLKSNRVSDVLLDGSQTPQSPMFQIRTPRMHAKVLDDNTKQVNKRKTLQFPQSRQVNYAHTITAAVSASPEKTYKGFLMSRMDHQKLQFMNNTKSVLQKKHKSKRRSIENK